MRSLSIRTYKVVPFSSNDGVMEFVANTEPIGNILATAHERYARGMRVCAYIFPTIWCKD